MRWAKPILFVMGAAAAWLGAADVVLAQCAMCRTALLNSPEGQKMAVGFSNGILFLLSAPFVVMGTMTFLILKAHLGTLLRRVTSGGWSARGPWPRPRTQITMKTALKSEATRTR